MSGPIRFNILTPNTDDKANIRHALSLGLPEADRGGKRLTLIANGPSARSFCFTRPLLTDTMAVNGALRLFKESPPTWWICCDPQGPEHNAMTPVDFLQGELPEETTYLVASKCHPQVFERLRDRKVQLWHVSDNDIPGVRTVPCAVSVTLCALMLAMRLGYRRIDVWGWDCCYSGDEHHAGDGDLSVTAEPLDIEVGDGDKGDVVWDAWNLYKSNPTWCCEVEDARKILPVLKYVGMDIRIHGASMLAAIVPEYAHA